MADSSCSASPAAWSRLVEPDPVTLHHMRYAVTGDVTKLTECGVDWDAVVVAPLQRGLRALDLLELPLKDGCPVIGDYARSELVVLVPLGTAASAAGLPGVRVLSRGSWLLVPTGQQGAYPAVWLSGPGAGRYVEVPVLREALLRTDAERVKRGRVQMHDAVPAAAEPARAH